MPVQSVRTAAFITQPTIDDDEAEIARTLEPRARAVDHFVGRGTALARLRALEGIENVTSPAEILQRLATALQTTEGTRPAALQPTGRSDAYFKLEKGHEEQWLHLAVGHTGDISHPADSPFNWLLGPLSLLALLGPSTVPQAKLSISLREGERIHRASYDPDTRRLKLVIDRDGAARRYDHGTRFQSFEAEFDETGKAKHIKIRNANTFAYYTGLGGLTREVWF